MTQNELTIFTLAVSAIWLSVAGGGYAIFLWWRRRDRPKSPR